MLVQLKQGAVRSVRRAISSQTGHVVFRKSRHFLDRHVAAEEPQLCRERRAVVRTRFDVNPKRRISFRVAKWRRSQRKKNSDRKGFHGRLIKGLTGFATFGD